MCTVNSAGTLSMLVSCGSEAFLMGYQALARRTKCEGSVAHFFAIPHKESVRLQERQWATVIVFGGPRSSIGRNATDKSAHGKRWYGRGRFQPPASSRETRLMLKRPRRFGGASLRYQLPGLFSKTIASC